MKLNKLLFLLMIIDNKFIIIPTGSNIRAIRTPPEPTNLLPMRLILINNPRPQIPTRNRSIPTATRQKPTIPIQTSNSPPMSLEVIIFLHLYDIEHFDLTQTISYCQFVVVAEGDGTDVVGGG